RAPCPVAPSSLVSVHWHRAPRHLPSFPTRRSSDLAGAERDRSGRDDHDLFAGTLELRDVLAEPVEPRAVERAGLLLDEERRADLDRKSTRLNSSHVKISYAVFCLKKKKDEHGTTHA